MDGQVSQLEQLLREGRGFNFSNFCLSRRSQRASEHEYGGADTPEWLAWKTRVFNLVQRVASDNSPAMQLVKTGIAIRTEGFYPENFERAQSNLLKALELAIDALKADTFNEARKLRPEAPPPTLPKTTPPFAPSTRRVFIVHGHDEALKLDVARFVEKLGLEAVILTEQANHGRTVIEKLEAHAENAEFAIVLLTPDDVGAQEDRLQDVKSRAGQDVVLELGYFIGKLTRKRVCALHKGDVELPSDILGVGYLPVSGNWKLQLAVEMKTAWPDLDLNKAY